jgi:hypothetical protein
MEPGCSLPLSQKPCIRSCSELNQSSPRPAILFKIHFNAVPHLHPDRPSGHFAQFVVLFTVGLFSTLAQLCRGELWGGGYRGLTLSVLEGIFVAIFCILSWHLGGCQMPHRILFRYSGFNQDSNRYFPSKMPARSAAALYRSNVNCQMSRHIGVTAI